MGARAVVLAAALGAWCCVFLGAPGAAQLGQAHNVLDAAKRRFYAKHLSSYRYRAAVSVRAAVAVTGTMEVTVTNATVAGTTVDNQVPAATNGTASIADVAVPVEDMFTRIAAGTAEVGQQLGGVDPFSSDWGYPLRFTELGAGREYTIEIIGFTQLATNAELDRLTAEAYAAQERWNTKGWPSYHYTFRQTCPPPCPNPSPSNPTVTRPVIVNVHTGVVASVVDAETRTAFGSSQVFYTFTQVFEIIREAIDMTPTRAFRAVYDAELGYPTLFAHSTESGVHFDQSPTMYFSDAMANEVAVDNGSNRTVWIVAIVMLGVCAIMAILMCVVYRYLRRDKRGAQDAPTNRARADREEARDAAAKDRQRAAATAGPQIDYGPEEMRPRGQPMSPTERGDAPQQSGGVAYDV